MKRLTVANWKENKNVAQARFWLGSFLAEFPNHPDFCHVVLGVSFPLLYPVKAEVSRRHLNLGIAAQDTSLYEQGTYTGEVSAKQLAGLADYVFLGHSERQKYFGETLKDVAGKIALCRQYRLTPLIFLRNSADLRELQQQSLIGSETVLVYEPPSAISRPGLYQAEKPDTVADVLRSFRREIGAGPRLLYGGSVNAENAADFLKITELGGFVIGQASLDPKTFAQLVKITQEYDAP